jgi:hypothetical protein
VNLSPRGEDILFALFYIRECSCLWVNEGENVTPGWGATNVDKNRPLGELIKTGFVKMKD